MTLVIMMAKSSLDRERENISLVHSQHSQRCQGARQQIAASLPEFLFLGNGPLASKIQQIFNSTFASKLVRVSTAVEDQACATTAKPPAMSLQPVSWQQDLIEN